MLDIWKGVGSLLDFYVQIENQDFVVIIYTSDAFESAAWVSAALEQREISYVRIWMAPLYDQNFEKRLVDAIPNQNNLKRRLILLSFERDTMSHTSIIWRVMSTYRPENVIALRAISAGPELFSVALLPTPDELESRNAYLLEHIGQAKSLHITTPGGSDFNVILDSSRYRWISNRGRIKPGGTVILPAGEVATFPVSIDGHFIADFAYNVNTVTERDVRLNKSPVHVSLEKGMVVDIQCNDKETMKYISESLSNNKFSTRVGEIGFGTNFSIKKSIPLNSHVNERCPGVHIGLGQHNQNSTIVEYQCDIHLDLIAYGGLVWADDVLVVDLSNIPPSNNPHPSYTNDEDVFSPDASDDCCGVIRCDLVSDVVGAM
jgi:leucyl aminopeptidase (aminopeptidase T)